MQLQSDMCSKRLHENCEPKSAFHQRNYRPTNFIGACCSADGHFNLKGRGHVYFHNAFLAPILSLGDVETQNNIFEIIF